MLFIKRIIRKTSIAAICAAVTFSGLMLSTAPAAAAESDAAVIAAANGTAYYVDCAAPGTGNGTLQSPINNLQAVNSLSLQPGDSVLFKRGATCLGQFAPSGSGTETAPILIGAYGTGTANPIINANGQTNAALLRNMQHVQMRDLELTAPGDNTTIRRGVYVLGVDSGEMHGVVLENLTVHDVRGQMPSTTGGGASSSTGKFGNASGGIIIEAQGTVVPTAYHGIQILNNKVYSVDRQGIYFWSNWCKRPELSRWGNDCTKNWYPHTNVTIRGNQLSDIGGDGIVPKMVEGGLVEHNSLEGFNVRSRSYNAGMWTANSNNITFQYNRTSGGVSTLDGMAYDIDHATDGIIFQYNLSYDNEGGFFLFCPDTSNTKNFIIRYNVSINDRTQLFLHGCGGEISNGKIYNNTMYIGDGLSPKVYVQSGSPTRNVEFFNNIVYKTGAGSAGWSLTSTNFKMDRNVFHNLTANPSWATNTITADPQLVNPVSFDPRGYRLGVGSPALGAGALIGANGGRDYYGNPVSSTKAPNIGAYEGPGVLATPEEGCLPSFSVAYDPAQTVNGIAHLTATIGNPCAGAFTDLTMSAGGPIGVTVNPATQLISRLEPGATVSIEMKAHNASSKPIANYPVDISIANKQGELLGSKRVNVELIAASWKPIESENFEGMAAGQSPNGWATSGNIPPVVVSEGDVKALKLVQSSGSINRSVWSFAEKAGTVKLTARVKAGQKNMPLGVHVLDSQDGEVLKLSLNLLGTVSYTNAGAFVDTSHAYNTDVWQTLEAIVDRDTSSYIVFLDGVRVGQGNLGPSTKPISKLRLQVPSGTASGQFLVDQVSFAEPGPAAPQFTIALDQASYSLTEGDTKQVKVNKTENGTVTDVTAQSVFEVTGSGIAAIDAAGLLKAVQEGTATVKATYQGMTAEAAVVVSAKQVEKLRTVLAGPLTVKPGDAFTVRYGVRGAKTPITAQDIIVLYDANLLEYTGEKELSEGLGIVAVKSDTPGSLRLIAASTRSGYAVSGDQPDLLELSFRARSSSGQASAVVSVSSALFGDAEGNEYSAAVASHELVIDVSISGDMNGDGKVSIGDLAIIAVHYGKTSESPDWASIKTADLNNDGVIDIGDLAVLARLLLK